MWKERRKACGWEHPRAPLGEVAVEGESGRNGYDLPVEHEGRIYGSDEASNEGIGGGGGGRGGRAKSSLDCTRFFCLSFVFPWCAIFLRQCGIKEIREPNYGGPAGLRQERIYVKYHRGLFGSRIIMMTHTPSTIINIAWKFKGWSVAPIMGSLPTPLNLASRQTKQGGNIRPQRRYGFSWGSYYLG